jgi:hypothetical protein
MPAKRIFECAGNKNTVSMRKSTEPKNSFFTYRGELFYSLVSWLSLGLPTNPSDSRARNFWRLIAPSSLFTYKYNDSRPSASYGGPALGKGWWAIP